MHGIPAAVASIACFAAWAGCSFGSPSVRPADAPTDDAPTGDGPGDAPGDGPPTDAPDVQLCLTDPTYVDPGTGHRYKRLDQDADYDTAIDRCAADGAHLAVAETSAENDHLRGLHTADMWIGFDDLTQENVFQWVTGATPGFEAFSGPEPNDNGVEDCTYLRTNGSWNDTDCGEPKRPICECDPQYKPPATPACRTATTGFVTRYGRRFFVRATPRKFQQARDDCASIGAHLIVIGDLDENTDLDLLLAGATWLGYTDGGTEGTFRWVNQSPSIFNRWPGGNAPSDDPLDCAVLQDLGAWANVDCGDTYAYACECDPAPP